MNIHEYQGKALLKRYGIPVPTGMPCFSVEEACQAAEKLAPGPWVVKAQIHAGGRGKGGGVKLAQRPEEVREHASSILGMQLVTHQTGPEGQKVGRLLVESGANIEKEFYLSILTDRATQKVCMIASPAGGMDIEAVAAETPDLIHKLFIDPLTGLDSKHSLDFIKKMGLPGKTHATASDLLSSLYRAFMETDASLIEINPLVVTKEQSLIALDAKISFDESALFRQAEISSLRDLSEEDKDEIEASKHGLSYISLSGNIGCLVNGAGLAMATMDTIQLFGSSPANFLDVGGGATTEKVTEAFKLMLRNPNIKAILVNIFGGIMRCDVIATGIISAVKQIGLNLPLIVRMKGTNEESGKQLLAESGLKIIPADTMSEAAQKAAEAAAQPL